MNNFACNLRCQTKQIDIALQSTREHMRPQCISVIRNEHALKALHGPYGYRKKTGTSAPTNAAKRALTTKSCYTRRRTIHCHSDSSSSRSHIRSDPCSFFRTWAGAHANLCAGFGSWRLRRAYEAPQKTLGNHSNPGPILGNLRRFPGFCESVNLRICVLCESQTAH